MDASRPHSPTSLRAPKTRKGVWRLQGMGQGLSHGRACGTVGQGLGLSLLFFAGFLALATARDGEITALNSELEIEKRTVQALRSELKSGEERFEVMQN